MKFNETFLGRHFGSIIAQEGYLDCKDAGLVFSSTNIQFWKNGTLQFDDANDSNIKYTIHQNGYIRRHLNHQMYPIFPVRKHNVYTTNTYKGKIWKSFGEQSFPEALKGHELLTLEDWNNALKFVAKSHVRYMKRFIN